MMKTPLMSGRTSTSGWCHLSFSRITDCMEICAAPTTHSSSPGARSGTSFGPPATSQATVMSHSATWSKGSGLQAPPSISTRPSMLTGRKSAGIETEAAIAGRSGPSVRIASRPGVEVAGDDLQRDLQLLERLRQELEAGHEGFQDQPRRRIAA